MTSRLGFFVATSITSIYWAFVPGIAAAEQVPVSEVPQQNQANSTDDLQEIVVTGYSQALQAAQKLKQNSAEVIEALAPEDLGKFSDVSIADELQRVPGVEIDRGTDARTGDRVAIRGMGAQFITTTVNGRTPAAYGNGAVQQIREFPIDILPTEILNGATVYKTPSAEMIESGLGGEVDIQTLRPLDYKNTNGTNYFGTLTVKGENTSTGNDWGYGVSGLFGAQLLDNTLGVYVAGIHSDSKYLQNFMELRPSIQTTNIRQSDGSVAQEQLIFPQQAEVGNMRRDFKRDAVSTDLQWRPTDSLEFNIDYLYSQYDRIQNRDYVEETNYGAGNGIFEPGGIAVQNGYVTGLNYAHYTPAPGSVNPGSTVGFVDLPIVEYYRDQLQIGGLNGKWHDDRWTVAGDVSLNRTVASDSINIFYSLTGLPNPGVNVTNFSANTSGAPTLNAGAPAVTSSAPFEPGLGIFIPLTNHTDGGAAKLDASFKANDNLTIKGGFRYAETDVDIRNLQYTHTYSPAENALLQNTLYPGGVDTVISGIQMPHSDPQAVINANNGLFPRSNLNAPPFTGPFSALLHLPNGWSLPGNFPSHTNRERTFAYYGQIDGSGTLFGLPTAGNVGLRVVTTEESAQAFQFANFINGSGEASGATPPPPQSVSATNSYTTLLPAANLKFSLRQGMALRFAVGETMSRPEFEDMAPTNALSVPDPSLHLTNNGSGTIGNAKLKPEKTWNFDTTWEYYTDGGASYVASAYYKLVSDFIAPQTVHNVTVPGFGSQLFDVATAANVSGGKAYGIETGFNQPLKNLSEFLSGAGFQANYTLSISKIDQPFSGHIYSFPGAARHNINAVLYYDKGPIDTRVAMVYRTSYLSAFPIGATGSFPVYTDAAATVDASATYRISENFGISLTASNLTAAGRRDFIYESSNFYHYYTNPRTLTLAARGKF
jgi:iron complex outermembrane receptor protein